MMASFDLIRQRWFADISVDERVFLMALIAALHSDILKGHR